MNNHISKKLKKDNISKTIIFILSSIAIVSLFLMFSFIIKEAFPAYKKYGFWHIYFTSDFRTGGILGALFTSLFCAFTAVIIALPISVRTSIFMRYRIKKGKKVFKIIIDILAGVPSVIFGVFALKSLNSFSSIFIGNPSNPLTIFNATMMLVMMIFPTMVSLISNQLVVADKTILSASMSLGNTKTASIYKVTKKSIKPGIMVAVIVSLGRAIGETMALSMILSGTSSHNPIDKGFGAFLSSPFATLGVEIATNMFTDSADPIIRSKAFAAGIGMFLVILLLVFGTTKLSNQKIIINKTPFINKERINKIITKSPSKIIGWVIVAWKLFILPFALIRFWFIFGFEKISYYISILASLIATPIYKLMFPQNKDEDLRQFYTNSSRSKIHIIFDGIRIFFEIFSMFIIVGATMWIIADVFNVGLSHFTAKDRDPMENGVMNAVVWTLLLIILSITIAVPFAFGTSLYLSEYGKNKKSGDVIKFFLDALGGTPSILFGIFGMILFLNTMQINSRVGSTSLIAGSLTMSLVILPTFARSIEQVLIGIPDSQRYASYALGASKLETIRKIILPKAIPGIISGVILSMGRIVSETAPVFLTLGMSYNRHFDGWGRGQTLTTKILSNQIFGMASADETIITSYKFASAAIILVTLIILLSYSVEPLINMIKTWRHRKVVKNG